MNIRRAIFFLVLSVVVFSTTTMADDSAAGLWTLDVTNPQGPAFHMNVELQQQGEKITGTWHAAQGEVAIRGTLKGSNVILNIDLDQFEPGLTIVLTLSGKLDGDSMGGTADYETFGGGEWTGKRVKK